MYQIQYNTTERKQPSIVEPPSLDGSVSSNRSTKSAKSPRKRASGKSTPRQSPRGSPRSSKKFGNSSPRSSPRQSPRGSPRGSKKFGGVKGRTSSKQLRLAPLDVAGSPRGEQRSMYAADTGTPAIRSITQQKQMEEERIRKQKAKARARAMSKHQHKMGKLRKNKQGQMVRRFAIGDEVVVKGQNLGRGVIRYIGRLKIPKKKNTNELVSTPATDVTDVTDTASPVPDTPADTTEDEENGAGSDALNTEKKKKDRKRKEKKPIWYGIELIEENAIGTCDGTFENHKWFDCAPNKGVFVHRNQMHKYSTQTTLKYKLMRQRVCKKENKIC